VYHWNRYKWHWCRLFLWKKSQNIYLFTFAMILTCLVDFKIKIRNSLCNEIHDCILLLNSIVLRTRSSGGGVRDVALYHYPHEHTQPNQVCNVYVFPNDQFFPDIFIHNLWLSDRQRKHGFYGWRLHKF
jgi:hypothetical protein